MKGKLLLFTLLIALTTSAQNEMWLGVSVKKKLNKNWNTYYNFSYRNKIFDGYSFLGQVSGGYEIFKKMEIKLKYRYTYKYALGLNYSQRLAIDYTYKPKLLKRTKLNYRLRLQGEKENTRDSWNYPYSLVVRNKFIINRKINKTVKLNIGNEIFSDLVTSKAFNGWRFYLGTVLDVGKKKEMKISYIYERKIHLSFEYKSSNTLSLLYKFG